MSGMRNIIKGLNVVKSVTGGKSLDRSLTEIGRSTVEKMRRDAPEDTGLLKRNIEFEVDDGNLIIESTAEDPDTGQDYAWKQEFGTRFLPAQPYFYKNIRGHLIPQLVKKIKSKLKGFF